MHKYYFKIKKNDTELEFSTDDINEFDERVLAWVNSICIKEAMGENSESSERMDFIDIKNLVKVKEMAEELEEPKENAFEDILDDAINNPKVKVHESIYADSDLFNLFKHKNAKDILEYFIVTAYFMINSENILNFSLKQVNSRIVPLVKEAVTHDVVNDALSLSYIEIVPDLTGEGMLTQYTLTQKGEDYYNSL